MNKKKSPIIFSIIITAYNVEKFIKRSVLSAINLDFCSKNFEIIIVDDKSRDKTATILNKLKRQHPFLRIIRNKKNTGPGLARNIGLRYAKGKYISFLDGDDALKKNFFKEISILVEKNPDLVFFNFNFINEKKKNLWQKKRL